MNVHTNNIQIISQDGKPAFAVIPYDDYLQLANQTRQEATIPHEVVGMLVEKEWNLVKAWRKYLGISQKVLAKKAGISQPALSQMERSDNLRDTTLEKLALAMGLKPELLVD
jgi:DNA-binding XRE family transcriptional regulator